jgi:hypothetical protein
MEKEQKEKKEVQPTIGEFQGNPIISIPTVDNPYPETISPLSQTV